MVTTQYLNWIIGIKWSRSPGSDCSPLTIGSKGNEFMSLFCYHSRDLSPQSQRNSHILSGMSTVLLKRNYRPSDIPFYYMHTPSSPVFHSLFFSLVSSFRRTSFLLLEGCPSTWLLTLWDSACSVFFHHQYHRSLPLHWLKESWVLEKSSNWNQHWILASLPSILCKAGVSSLIMGTSVTPPSTLSPLFLQRKYRCLAFYKNLYLILYSI